MERKTKPGCTGYKFVSARQDGTYCAQVNRRNYKFFKYGFETPQAAHAYAVEQIRMQEAKSAIDGPCRIQYDCPQCGFGQPEPIARCPKCGSTAIEKNKIPQRLITNPPSGKTGHRPGKQAVKTPQPLPAIETEETPTMPPVKTPKPSTAKSCFGCSHFSICRIRDKHTEPFRSAIADLKGHSSPDIISDEQVNQTMAQICSFHTNG